MSMKPRIAIIGDFPIGKIYSKFPDRVSSYPTWLFNLYKGFATAQDYDIHWIIADKQIKEKEVYRSENQTFHLLPATSLTVGLYTGYILNRWRIMRCIKSIRPDIVHSWGTERFYSFVTKDFNGKTLLSIQGLLKAYGQRARISPFEKKHSLYEDGIIRAAKFITTESPWAADRVREVAPHANIMHWEYAAEEEFSLITRELEEAPSCLLIGNNTPVKNVQLAIKAFSNSALKHVKLYLAGIPESSYPGRTENIIPLGKLDRQSLLSYMKKTWALVHTSLADTGPTVVKEARVAGLPVILTTDCGSKQHVDEGESGFILQPNDEQALINAVLKLTESKNVSISMGAHQREQCQEKLSIKTMVSRILEIYNLIISN